MVHGMTVVTRNAADFAATGALLINPWEAVAYLARIFHQGPAKYPG
jgi:hypothetical protein